MCKVGGILNHISKSFQHPQKKFQKKKTCLLYQSSQALIRSWSSHAHIISLSSYPIPYAICPPNHPSSLEASTSEAHPVCSPCPEVMSDNKLTICAAKTQLLATWNIWMKSFFVRMTHILKRTWANHWIAIDSLVDSCQLLHKRLEFLGIPFWSRKLEKLMGRKGRMVSRKYMHLQLVRFSLLSLLPFPDPVLVYLHPRSTWQKHCTICLSTPMHHNFSCLLQHLLTCQPDCQMVISCHINHWSFQNWVFKWPWSTSIDHQSYQHLHTSRKTCVPCYTHANLSFHFGMIGPWNLWTNHPSYTTLSSDPSWIPHYYSTNQAEANQIIRNCSSLFKIDFKHLSLIGF